MLLNVTAVAFLCATCTKSSHKRFGIYQSNFSEFTYVKILNKKIQKYYKYHFLNGEVMHVP